MIPYRLVNNRTAAMALIAGTLHGAVLYAVLLYFPLFFQAVFLQTPLKSAISMLPACCLSVGLSIISPIAVEATRRYRVQLWIGWVLLTLFLGLWCIVDQGTSHNEYDAFLALLGSGIGIVRAFPVIVLSLVYWSLVTNDLWSRYLPPTSSQCRPAANMLMMQAWLPD